MPRQTREQVEEQIVDRAAALFAQHGFAHTSLQAVADAVGYSKAGLLHHFPSKEALHAAAEALTQARIQRVLDAVADLPVGPERDRYALEQLVDWAFASPGQTALGLSMLPLLAGDEPFPTQGEDGVPILRVFGVVPGCGDPERLIRVVSALSGLLVTSLVASRASVQSTWRDVVLTTALDALGHRRSSASPSPLVPAEA